MKTSAEFARSLMTQRTVLLAAMEQARVPAGNETGGQFASSGGATGGMAAPAVSKKKVSKKINIGEAAHKLQEKGYKLGEPTPWPWGAKGIAYKVTDTKTGETTEKTPKEIIAILNASEPEIDEIISASDQPRVPAGNATGGQFASKGGAAGTVAHTVKETAGDAHARVHKVATGEFQTAMRSVRQHASDLLNSGKPTNWAHVGEMAHKVHTLEAARAHLDGHEPKSVFDAKTFKTANEAYMGAHRQAERIGQKIRSKLESEQKVGNPTWGHVGSMDRTRQLLRRVHDADAD